MSSINPAPTMRKALALLAASLLSVALIACASPLSNFRSSQASVRAGQVDVQLLEMDGDTFKFYVTNLSDQHMTLMRDRIMLKVGGGSYPRIPGGIKSTYDLPPGGGHDVNVAYDMSLLEGVEQFEISFADAVLQRADPVPAPSFSFVRAQD